MVNQRWLPGVLALVTASIWSGAQAQAPQAGALLNRMSTTYRTMGSYSDTATLTRKLGDKEMTPSVMLAAQRPNKFLLDVKGDKVNTLVVSDGTSLISYRPDRNAYTKSKAPAYLMNTDILAKLDLPTPGSRIISILLQGGLRSADNALATRLSGATITGPQGFGSKMAFVLAFRYDDEYDAKVYVTEGDNIIRRVTLFKEGVPQIVENRTEVSVDKPLAADLFTRTVPETARLVAVLPQLETVAAAVGFQLRTTSGKIITQEDLKGKVVLMSFFFTT